MKQLLLWWGILFTWSSMACGTALGQADERSDPKLPRLLTVLQNGDGAAREISRQRIAALGVQAAPALSTHLMQAEDPIVRAHLERAFRRVTLPMAQSWRSSVAMSVRTQNARTASQNNAAAVDLEKLGPPVWPMMQKLAQCAPLAIAEQAGRFLKRAAADTPDFTQLADDGAFQRLHYFYAPVLKLRQDDISKAHLRRHMVLALSDMTHDDQLVRERAEEGLCFMGAEAIAFFEGQPDEQATDGGRTGRRLLAPLAMAALKRRVSWCIWPSLGTATGLGMADWQGLTLRDRLARVAAWQTLGGEDGVPVLRMIRKSAVNPLLVQRTELALFQLDALEIPEDQRRFPSTLLVHFAKIARGRGNLQKALDFLEEAFNKDADNPLVCFELACALLDAKQFERSVARFMDYLSGSGKGDEVSHYAAQLREASGAFQAAGYLKRILKAHPKSRKVGFEVAMSLLLARHLDEAIERFHGVLKIPPPEKNMDRLLWYNLACAYALSGNKPAALNALEQALDLGWDDVAHIKTDSDLDSIRSMPGFKKLLKALSGE